MLLLLDYGIGNIRSLEKAFQAAGHDPVRSADPALVTQAERLVLPGVGAFGACAAEIRRRGLWDPIRAAVDAGTPLLGVCVGMQLLFDASEELAPADSEGHPGFGFIPGRVVRFPNAAVDGTALKVPHMGWNAVRPMRSHPLLEGDDGQPLSGTDADSYFYFVHSYHAQAAAPSDVLGVAHYGADFPAVVQRGHVMGVQFHPEKSQGAGLHLLRRFATLAPAPVA
ncbi:MAG: imidazole glycerol phosphate synthase subunit HisH [Bacteroidota bacterium]